MANRLQNAASPYLLQHAGNPVDWYPWGEEAFAKARVEDKPIFLSIGYAACHWCHVMERESFEDPRIAAYLNEHFVSIKVDREELPDVDSYYMSAVVAMTGQGGWPLSVFLTPELEPFFGGTYFPPVPRYGMPSFAQVLEAVHQTWVQDRSNLEQLAQKVRTFLLESYTWQPVPSTTPWEEVIENAFLVMDQSYDWQNGGWGRAPKFPQPMAIEFLLLQAARGNERARTMAIHALKALLPGGLRDTLGGGFHRYATDATWCIPHFEKMLYDNAQLAMVYGHAYLLTNDAEFRFVWENTLDFVLEELRDTQGGFYASLDADSEGEEGKYYLWSPNEIFEVITDPEEREFFNAVYRTDAAVTHEGKWVLRMHAPMETLIEHLQIPREIFYKQLASLHHKLREQRAKRTRPTTDDKILVSWNALAIQALAQAGRYLGSEKYMRAAQAAASFILEHLYHDRSLHRSWHQGRLGPLARLEDYAALIIALLDLYQSDFNEKWYTPALALTESLMAQFGDPTGGFFDTPVGDTPLPIRPKEVQDNATPSGNALAIRALQWMTLFEENPAWEDQIHHMLSWIGNTCARYPLGFAYWLQNLDFALGPVSQVALLWQDPNALTPFLEVLWKGYHPRLVVVGGSIPPSATSPGLLHGLKPQHNAPVTVYFCDHFVCRAPITSPEALSAQISTI